MATITTFKTNALPTKTVGTLQLQSKIPTAVQTKPVITTVARPVVSQQAATAENVKLDIIKQTSQPASSLISWVPEKQETAVQTPTTATQQVQTKPVITTIARPVISQQTAIKENVTLDIIKQTSKPASSLISWVPEKQETAVQTSTTATQPLQQEQIFNEVQNEQAQEQQPPVEQVAEQTAPATDDKKKKIIFIIIAVIAIWLLFFKKD